uniref:Uncharacterized protein n=1 Tax=Oryza rufipogon TaxID=4529 RepID=A0A0E0N0Y2_ORYRU
MTGGGWSRGVAGAAAGGAVAGELVGRGCRPPCSLILDMNLRGIDVEATEEVRSKCPRIVVGEDGRASGGGGRPLAERRAGGDLAKDAVRTSDARGATTRNSLREGGRGAAVRLGRRPAGGRERNGDAQQLAGEGRRRTPADGWDGEKRRHVPCRWRGWPTGGR